MQVKDQMSINFNAPVKTKLGKQSLRRLTECYDPTKKNDQLWPNYYTFNFSFQ